MSDSISNDDFALFAEFLKWKQSKEKSSSAISKAAAASVLVPEESAEVELTQTLTPSPAAGTTNSQDLGSPIDRGSSPVGGSAPTASTSDPVATEAVGRCSGKVFTANDYLSRDKKYNAARRNFV